MVQTLASQVTLQKMSWTRSTFRSNHEDNTLQVQESKYKADFCHSGDIRGIWRQHCLIWRAVPPTTYRHFLYPHLDTSTATLLLTFGGIKYIFQ